MDNFIDCSTDIKSRKSKLTTIIAVVASLCLLLTVLAACSGTKTLNGTYNHKLELDNGELATLSLVFTSDGHATLTLIMPSDEVLSALSGTYSISGDTITFDWVGTGSATYSFVQRGNTLTIDGDDFKKA